MCVHPFFFATLARAALPMAGHAKVIQVTWGLAPAGSCLRSFSKHSTATAAPRLCPAGTCMQMTQQRLMISVLQKTATFRQVHLNASAHMHAKDMSSPSPKRSPPIPLPFSPHLPLHPIPSTSTVLKLSAEHEGSLTIRTRIRCNACSHPPSEAAKCKLHDPAYMRCTHLLKENPEQGGSGDRELAREHKALVQSAGVVVQSLYGDLRSSAQKSSVCRWSRLHSSARFMSRTNGCFCL